jgi:membrane protein YdbS with pleckstrin-like domain
MSGNDRSGTPDGVPDDDRPPGSAERSDAPNRDGSPSTDAPTDAGDGSQTAATDSDGAAAVEGVVDDLTIPPQSLHPRVRIVWVLRGLVSATLIGVLVGGVGTLLDGLGPRAGVAAFLVVGVLTVVHALARYRTWGYEVREDALYLERGVLTRVRTVVPYVRIQHVDASRGPLERTFGLASSVVYTAGSRGADVTIPGLTPEKSEDLQERLKRLAILAEGDDAV